MGVMSALFDFDLLLAEADREGYYHTRWDLGTRVTVRSETKQDAINKAAAALGAPRPGRYWAAKVKSVTDAAVSS